MPTACFFPTTTMVGKIRLSSLPHPTPDKIKSSNKKYIL
jgi:hypothetical protein